MSSSLGRPKLDLNLYKDFIVQLFHEDYTLPQICNRLERDFSITVARSTLLRRFKIWDISKRQRTMETPELCARIQILFFDMGLDDTEMLLVLNAEGYQLGKTGLEGLRKKLGLIRRLNSGVQREEADKLVEDVVQQELVKGVIQGYGREYLYRHFRRSGYIFARYIF